MGVKSKREDKDQASIQSSITLYWKVTKHKKISNRREPRSQLNRWPQCCNKQTSQKAKTNTKKINKGSTALERSVIKILEGFNLFHSTCTSLQSGTSCVGLPYLYFSLRYFLSVSCSFPASIVISGRMRHLDGISAMALHSGPSSGRCQSNFEEKKAIS